MHPGGPFWVNKDAGAWSIPKGEPADGEDLLEAAKRELIEETGVELDGFLLPLGHLRTPGGKVLHAWAAAGDCDPAAVVSNTFRLEWPPRSGRYAEFPEVDRAAWFSAAEAVTKLHKGQSAFVTRLQLALS